MSTLPPPPQHNRRLPIGYEPLAAIHPNSRDARTYSRADRRRVVAAVRRFGPPPLIVTAERVLLSGNIWLEAAQLAGYVEAPVIVAEHLSPAEADAYMLAHVRLVERGEWDQRLLGEILQDLSVGELAFDLDLTGFEPAEIDLAIEALEAPEAGPDPADAPAPAGPAVTKLGDIWQLRDSRLLCGDALDVDSYAKVMDGDLAAVVITDPPYNVRIAGNVSGMGKVKHLDFTMASGEMTEAEFTAFLVEALTHAAASCAPGGLAYVFMDWRHMHEVIVAARRVFEKCLNLCVWVKNHGGKGSFYRSAHELIFVFRKAGASHRNNIQFGRFGRDRTNVWKYPSVTSFGRHGEEGDLLALHPTVKPVAMLADILLDVTVRGEVVLDVFAGSGSILIAAEKVGRRGRGIELDPIYVDAAVRRWQRWTGEEARLQADGRTFGEIEVERTGEASRE